MANNGEIQAMVSRPAFEPNLYSPRAKSTDDRLSEDELLAMVFLLLVAGHETTEPYRRRNACE